MAFDRNNPTALMPGYGDDAASSRRLGETEIDELLGGEGFDAGDYVVAPPLPADVLAAELFEGYVDEPKRGGSIKFRSKLTAPYEDLAERYYKAGHIIGAGDATFQARDQLKALGCKWHAPKNAWVAPDANVLAQARAAVQKTKAVTVPPRRCGTAMVPPLPAKPLPPLPQVHTPVFDPYGFDPHEFDDQVAEPPPSNSAPAKAQANALQAAFGGVQNTRRPDVKAPTSPVQLLSTEEMIAELRNRGVLYEEPETLADALLERPPTESELDQAFDVEDLE